MQRFFVIDSAVWQVTYIQAKNRDENREISRDVSLRINIIDISMNIPIPVRSVRTNTPSDMNAEFTPPQRCQVVRRRCRNSHVATRHHATRSRVRERVCVVTATSTRFHRTVIDRGSRCGSRTKSTLPYQTNVECTSRTLFLSRSLRVYLRNYI